MNRVQNKLQEVLKGSGNIWEGKRSGNILNLDLHPDGGDIVDGERILVRKIVWQMSPVVDRRMEVATKDGGDRWRSQKGANGGIC